MFDILVDASLGALAAVIAYFLARLFASPKSQPQRHRIIWVVLVIIGFQAGHLLVAPQVQAWKHGQEIDELLSTDPLFSLVLSDRPELKAPVRAALLKAYETGSRAQAVAAGQALFGSVLPQYLSKASDEAIIRFTQATVHVLKAMAGRDPKRCYQYLFPKVAGSPIINSDEGQQELMQSMRGVAESAYTNPLAPDPSREGLLQALGSRLAAKFGSDVQVLRNAEAPDVDRTKVCTITIALYEDAVALPSREAGPLLRALFSQ